MRKSSQEILEEFIQEELKKYEQDNPFIYEYLKREIIDVPKKDKGLLAPIFYALKDVSVPKISKKIYQEVKAKWTQHPEKITAEEKNYWINFQPNILLSFDYLLAIYLVPMKIDEKEKEEIENCSRKIYLFILNLIREESIAKA